jgi:beta-lactamase superfamily II metal-dependent hydrolase
MKRTSILSLVLLLFLPPAKSQNLTPWQKGNLEIHHINTGSGNSSFFIFPDGTTLLFDAGEIDRKAKSRTSNPLKAAPALPNDSTTAAQCIVNYIQHVLPSIKQIDYAIISHFHADHFGSTNPNSMSSAKGKYKLSGITEVNEYLPIQKLIDRDYPNYNFPVDIKTHSFEKESFVNYLAFVETLSKITSVEKIEIGSNTQIHEKNPNPDFQIRTICANGSVWTGDKKTVTPIMPSLISAKEYNENPLSIALKISYGKFDYFTGGDLTGLHGFELPQWFDMETPVANVVGAVDALSLNHHGVRDATNEIFLKTLQPQVIIQQSWSSNHPGEEVLHRIISPSIYGGKRAIFATYIHQETITTYGRWLADNYQSMRGHIVIRVKPGGKEFEVFILDDSQLNVNVLKTFGPYYSK